MEHPFGTWPSPLSASSIAAHGVRLSSVAVGTGQSPTIYWLEGRPAEGGRSVLVACALDGAVRDVTPAGFNVRTRVQEYGGGAYLLDGSRVFFSNFSDQRIYAQGLGPDGPPVALTAEGAFQYADFTMDAGRQRLICVREDHTRTGQEAVTSLVAVSLGDGVVEVLAAGEDFYSTPRISADGRALCWLSWRHPRMPWDGTELWVASFLADGTLGPARCLAGGADESIYQPGWLDGTLIFASDRDGWWRLYRVDPFAEGSPVTSVLADPLPDAEFGRPQWLLGTSTWVPAGPDRLLVSFTRRGRWGLGLVGLSTGRLTPIAAEVMPGEWLATTASEAVLVAGFTDRSTAVVTVGLGDGHVRTLARASAVDLPAEDLSTAEPVEFPTAQGRTAYAFYYPPRLSGHRAPAGERPPLIVIGHGGPIAAAEPLFDLKVQFWTSRGFAVVDVNYGGSTGFGRDYRRRLNGQWGIVDVEDLIAAARYLVDRGLADPRRLAIRGGSAGGYTVLAALTQYPEVFAAGASYYGVSDLEALLHDSHKFESRCLDILVGPYPAMREEYRRRSPIHAVNRLECPLIVLQGLEDKVVPPNQAEMIVDALRAKGRPVAYLAFEGEQHGFRRAENIVRSLEAELYFYGAVFGFAPADRIEPVLIDNADALPSRHG